MSMVMADYMNQEYADMHLMCDRAEGNRRLAQRLYQQQYLRRRYSHHTTFATTDRLLREMVTFYSAWPDEERRTVRTPQIEETVLQLVANSPSIRTIPVVAELDVPHTILWNVVYNAKMYPFHIRKVKLLTEDDYSRRNQLVHCMLDITTHSNPQFPATVLFTN